MTRLLASEQGIARYRPNHRRKEDWPQSVQQVEKLSTRPEWVRYVGEVEA